MARRGHNEGSIRRRADGRWEARVSLGDGKRTSHFGKTRQEVAAKLAAAQRDRDLGVPAAPGRQTVAEYLDGWMEVAEATVEPTTWMRYEGLLRDHVLPEIGGTRLVKLDAGEVQRLYARKAEAGYSASTIHQMHAVLHRALKDAVLRGLVGRNVVDLATPPRVRREEMRVWTPEEVLRFLDRVAGDPREALYVLALATGLREGELLGLRWRDIELDRLDRMDRHDGPDGPEGGVLQVKRNLRRVREADAEGGYRYVWAEGRGKTKRARRRIALGAAVVSALRAHRRRQLADRVRAGAAWEDGDQVFCDEVGRPLTGFSVLFRFKTAARRARVPVVRFHDLRHTAATLMLLRGVHVKVVSEVLGHASVAITLDLYGHVLPDMQRQAAAAFDGLLNARAGQGGGGSQGDTEADVSAR